MNTHGGAREGAGRKRIALDEKRVSIAMRVKPSYRAWLKEQSEISNESIGKIIELLIDDYCGHYM